MGTRGSWSRDKNGTEEVDGVGFEDEVRVRVGMGTGKNEFWGGHRRLGMGMGL